VQFARLFGYQSTAELAGRNGIESLLAPASAKLLREHLLAGPLREPLEVTGVRKDGSAFPGETQSGLANYRGRDVMVTMMRDITARNKAEEALREREFRYRTVVETSTDGFWVLDRDGRILDVNRRYLERSGYSREELLGMTLFDIECSRTAEEIRRSLNIQGHREARIIEGLHRAKDASTWPVEVSSVYLPDEGGRFFSFLRDITERKRADEARLRSQKLAALGTLAGGIAHDFNNILTAIRGNAVLAAKGLGQDDPAMVSLTEIDKAGRRASELVRRIMAFGRPEQPRREVADLAAVVEEVLKLLRPTLPAGIALRTRLEPGLPSVLADAAQIHEVVVNLTTNAAHAIGRQSGSIDYVLEAVQVEERGANGLDLAPGRYALLTATDSGCGMDEATKTRIFDAYYTTKPVGEGTGLGLSMVYGVMQSHGGTVTVDSAPGKGSTFRLYFPATGESALEALAHRREVDLSVGMRIMYVDDEEAIVSLATRSLSRLGHSVSGFTDPKAALERFRAHPEQFDVVVTDLSMPGMSGIDLSRRLLAIRAEVPVLMTSGYCSAEDEAGARAAGVREVVLKPIDIYELARVLAQMDPRPETPAHGNPPPRVWP
jgi:PAS domain S-box-containing protein